MKSFSMNKVLGSIKRRPTFAGSEETSADPGSGTPEAIAERCVRQFCQSVGSATGDDVIFLPSIVEAAVASPAAAAECARLIRKYMTRDYWTKPQCQYNAIMLIRILTDNPGPGFTRNLDKKFVDTTKELLRSGRDASVRQILMETLDAFENTKSQDEGLKLMIEMWKKEKEKAYKAYGGIVPVAPVAGTWPAPAFHPNQFQQFQAPIPHRGTRGTTQTSRRLPDPVELANRLEEARTSAKLLEQVLASTPPSEVLSNELVKEFSDRCSSASRSIQGYMTAENPSPDNDTMESLIDTNEQLQQALNHHHRAVLQARKQLGMTSDSRSSSSNHRTSQQRQPTQPSLNRPVPPIPSSEQAGFRQGTSSSNGNGKGKAALDPYHSSSGPAAAIAGPSRSASATPHRDHDRAGRDTDDDDDDNQDPFRDPPNVSSSSRGAGGDDDGPPRLSFEPYHPGFTGASSSTAQPRAEPVTPVSDDGESDRYAATPKRADGGSGQGHVYRY